MINAIKTVKLNGNFNIIDMNSPRQAEFYKESSLQWFRQTITHSVGLRYKAIPHLLGLGQELKGRLSLTHGKAERLVSFRTCVFQLADDHVRPRST
jgi:hypothetical protein